MNNVKRGLLQLDCTLNNQSSTVESLIVTTPIIDSIPYLATLVITNHWRIYIQNFPAQAPPPLRDPILLLSHTFSPKSTHIGGPRPLKMGQCPPPYEKSWIHPANFLYFTIIISILYFTTYVINKILYFTTPVIKGIPFFTAQFGFR